MFLSFVSYAMMPQDTFSFYKSHLLRNLQLTVFLNTLCYELWWFFLTYLFCSMMSCNSVWDRERECWWEFTKYRKWKIYGNERLDRTKNIFLLVCAPLFLPKYTIGHFLCCFFYLLSKQKEKNTAWPQLRYVFIWGHHILVLCQKMCLRQKEIQASWSKDTALPIIVFCNSFSHWKY